MSPFIGSFTGSRAFGRSGGGSLSVWITNNSLSLISGAAGSPSAVYERVFTSVGSYTLSSPPFPISAQVLVVGGGGGASGGLSGGGGAGGVVYHPAFSISSTTSVTVGNGGANSSNHSTAGGNGEASVFSTLTANGGGRGGVWSTGSGEPGGCGGGSNGHWGGYYSGGPSNQPSFPGATVYGTRGGNKN